METARKRYLSSLGSRQATTSPLNSSKKMTSSLNSSMMAIRVSRDRYLSSLGRIKTSPSSSYFSLLTANCPSFLALSYAILGVEFLKKKALRSVLTSITNRLFFIQPLLKHIFGKTIFCGLLSSLSEQQVKINFFRFLQQTLHVLSQILLNLIPQLGRNAPLFLCNRVIHFNYNPFYKSLS
jgi:hypothetical protein